MRTFLNQLFAKYYEQTEANKPFRYWIAKNVENGKVALPTGVDEYDVYEAADNFQTTKK